MLIDNFGEKQIFGVFISGKINYQKMENFNWDKHPINIVYVPGIDELIYLNPLEVLSLSVNLPMKCNFIDFRQYRNSIYDKIDCITETLYNDYFIINPYYESLYKKISLVWKDFISHYHQEKRIKYLLEKSKTILRMIPKNTDNLASALFLFYIAHGINKEVSYNSFFEFEKNYTFQHQSLLDLAEGTLSQIQINNIYEILEQELNNFEIKVKETKPSKEVIEELERTFKRVFKASLKDITYTTNLTDLEQQALAAIKEEAGQEGYFSTSKLIEKTSISRAVFTSLIKKIKEGNVAEVTSCGVKGIHIKFY